MAMIIPRPTAASAARDCHDDEDKQLSRHVAKITREGPQRQIHGIQHQLDAHEHRMTLRLIITPRRHRW